MLSKAVNISVYRNLNGQEKTKSAHYLRESLPSLSQETTGDREDRQTGRQGSTRHKVGVPVHSSGPQACLVYFLLHILKELLLFKKAIQGC